MAALLSRTAERLYWAARYLERAEDTARLVLAFGELFDDLPSAGDDRSDTRWAALLAVFGTGVDPGAVAERDVVHRLVSDTEHPNSVVASVVAARSALRTTRELLPREAWRAVNDLWLFLGEEGPLADDRRFRGRVLGRVVDDSRRLDGILVSSMNRDDAWEMWRLGRYVERADMTTRVVGVRAAGLMESDGASALYDEVHWMGVLRSLSALQMYQRATRGPIEASSVVRFLLFDAGFPRSVWFCLGEVDRCLDQLVDPGEVRAAVQRAREALAATNTTTDDGADLNRAMDWVQQRLGGVNDSLVARYMSIGD